MKETYANIWDLHKKGNWICITTNGVLKADGSNVMGKGIAYQAKLRYPKLPKELGQRIKEYGNNVHVFPDYHLISVPTKYHWKAKSSLMLIERSIKQLFDIWTSMYLAKPLYLVRPGCSNGGRDWENEVKPILEKYLDDSFVVVEKPKLTQGIFEDCYQDIYIANKTRKPKREI